MRLILIAALMMSCGKTLRPTKGDAAPPATLVQKFKLYDELSLQHNERDALGFFSPGGSIGDSILFSCLHQFATGTKISVLRSFSYEGFPLRHPEITSEDSATPISRDMIIGFMICAISSPDGTEIMKRIVDVGRDNNWDLCGDAPEYNISLNHRLSRCIMSPGLISTIYRVRTYLGVTCNTACKIAQEIPTGLSTHVEGFKRHLSILHIIIRGHTGGISEDELDILEHHAKHEPNNALYQAAYHRFKDGNQSKAIHLLLNTSKFPEYGLPTTDNYCTHYLYQRDESSQHDWLPCDEGIQHTGIDFLFAGSLIL
jgi:hypothetical protein